MKNIRIDINVEEDCTCKDGGVLEIDNRGLLCTYQCMECEGSGKVYVRKEVTIKQFKDITGAK